MKMLALLPLIAFSLTRGIPATAQDDLNRIVKKYSIQDGLSQAVVNSITQDHKGLMWFATDEGLNRFDGYSFTTFRFDVDGDDQFHDSFVQKVFRDSRDRLWVSSRKGLYKLDLSTQRLNAFVNTSPGAGNDVSYMAEGSDGKLWIAWYWRGVGAFDPVSLTYDTVKVGPLTSAATITVFEDSYGFLWVGSQDKGLDVFRIKNGVVTGRQENLSVSEILPSKYVKCVTEDHLGNIWIGTTRGLVVYLRRENRFHVFGPFNGIPAGIGVFSLMEDSKKKLWLGTHGHGLYTIDLQNVRGARPEELAAHQIPALDQHDISRHTIRTIFEDRDKNIWLGTHGDGIYMISNKEKNFRKFATKKFFRSAESYVPYYGLCNDDEGFIWVGTDSEGIYKLTTNGERVRHYTADGKKGSIGDNMVMSALQDSEGRLWFGTYSQGVFLYDKRSDKFIHFPHAPTDKQVPLGNRVPVMFEDSKKNIWVSATRGGLCVIDKANRNFKLNTTARQFADLDVRAMAEDQDGGFWVGCYGGGLVHFDPVTLKFTTVSDGVGTENLLKSNVVHALAIDKDNVLWIGTGGGGLSAYDITDKTVTRFSEKEGLINNTVFGLQIDEEGNVWCSTIKGISKLDVRSRKFFNYTSEDGLQAGQFTPGSSWYNREQGYMCFGGAFGMNLFYPAKITYDNTVPEVRISAFHLFNKPVKVGGDGEDDVLDKVIDETERITLNHDQASFTFQFMALNFSYPEKNKYAYKLEGLDTEWIYSGNHRTASYRYVDPGHYEFKVKSAGQNGEWPETYASVQVEVLQPFWKTPLAFLFYIVMIASASYGLYAIRKKENYLRRRLKIEKEQRKRERQIVQEKLGFFTEVSHEFRTPLTLMIGPLEEMLSKEGGYTPAGKKLKLVYKNAYKLLHLINKLLDYRKIESGNMVLRVKEADVVAFTEEVFLNFRELALRKNIRFEFKAEEPAIRTWFDREKLEMVLNNVISNSFKYIGNGNSIKITVRRIDADG
ncbi:MAG TPA: two-component regulator propeller domain-containing protein, partial [Chryseosolibacter sp.]|nr:two-component regulator propeller domain-containing protein [Chryseosolibacter sp.]